MWDAVVAIIACVIAAFTGLSSLLPRSLSFSGERIRITQGFFGSLLSTLLAAGGAGAAAILALSIFDGSRVAPTIAASLGALALFVIVVGIMRSMNEPVILDLKNGVLELPVTLGVRKIAFSSITALRHSAQHIAGQNYSTTIHKIDLQHAGGWERLQFSSQSRLDKFVRVLMEQNPGIHRY